MMRNARQTKILELIEEQEIDTQEQLCRELERAHFKVTQATVSRDVRELGLYKVSGVQKRYRYTATRKHEGDLPERMRQLFEAGVESLTVVGNILVIKTMAGYGANAGAVIDLLNIAEIVGSIAGDDTVFSLCNSEEDAIAARDRLNEIAGNR